jgi:ketosteroid isomerase-like protein
MTNEFAAAFARDWVEAWNAHDLERILCFYTEDFIIESPMALKLLPESSGTVAGKKEVRKYWQIGLEKSPNLEFELLEVFVGVNSLSIFLLNKASNKRSIEVMSLNSQGKVYKCIVNFAA